MKNKENYHHINHKNQIQVEINHKIDQIHLYMKNYYNKQKKIKRKKKNL